ITPPPPSFSVFYCSAAHLAPHSFPTRRSSDLAAPVLHLRHLSLDDPVGTGRRRAGRLREAHRRDLLPHGPAAAVPVLGRGARRRSEEHTSELQSRFDLVCRLLLEIKKPLVSYA